MYLEEVLIEFRNGKKIRRSCWEKKEYIYFDSMCIVDEQGLEYCIDIDDIFANDWCFY